MTLHVDRAPLLRVEVEVDDGVNVYVAVKRRRFAINVKLKVEVNDGVNVDVAVKLNGRVNVDVEVDGPSRAGDSCSPRLAARARQARGIARRVRGTTAATRPAMTNTSDLAATPSSVTHDQLATVTGGGSFGDIGKLFGDKGARWGGVADSVLGMFGAGGTGGLMNLFKGLGGTGGKPSTSKPFSTASSSGETASPSGAEGSSSPDKLASMPEGSAAA